MPVLGIWQDQVQSSHQFCDRAVAVQSHAHGQPDDLLGGEFARTAATPLVVKADSIHSMSNFDFSPSNASGSLPSSKQANADARPMVSSSRREEFLAFLDGRSA
jgi:hypothetical protein